MNKLMKVIIGLVAVFLIAQPAFALNDTIGVTAGTGKTANLISFSGGNVISEVGICDATTQNQCAGVIVTSGGNYLGVYNGPTNDAATCVQGNSQDSCLRQIDADIKAPTAISVWAAGTLGAMANYGTSPGQVLVPGVNAFVTNIPAVTQSGGPWTGNQTQWNSVALGSPSAYGISPGAVNVTGVNAFVTNTPNVVPSLATSGGLSTYFLQPTASTNSNSVKASAGQVYWVLAENNSATLNYLRLYNTASGPTCSSATGLVAQIQIPASTSVGGINIALPFGIPFSTGIGICLTSGYATTDTTNATATAISLTIGYD